MKDKCTVTNKSAGSVVYSIPELGVRRVFYSKEKKPNIAVSELEKLVQMPGGLELLYNYLMVEDKEIINYLINGEVAPEYWLTEDKIPDWLVTSSLDEFKDALDFAPEGTKDLIKKYAVLTELNDFSKREAIKEQLGFDVTRAIENSKDDEQKAETKQNTRRVTPATTTPQRRVVVKSE